MKILFICDDNSILSPMAMSIAQALFENEAKVDSAGIASKPEVNFNMVKAMHQMDINIKSYRPKALVAISLNDFDVVVSLCLDNEPPKEILEKQYYEHWQFPPIDYAYLTPEEELDAIYQFRDRLVRRIMKLKKDLATINQQQ